MLPNTYMVNDYRCDLTHLHALRTWAWPGRNSTMTLIQTRKFLSLVCWFLNRGTDNWQSCALSGLCPCPFLCFCLCLLSVSVSMSVPADSRRPIRSTGATQRKTPQPSGRPTTKAASSLQTLMYVPSHPPLLATQLPRAIDFEGMVFHEAVGHLALYVTMACCLLWTCAETKERLAEFD